MHWYADFCIMVHVLLSDGYFFFRIRVNSTVYFNPMSAPFILDMYVLMEYSLLYTTCNKKGDNTLYSTFCFTNTINPLLTTHARTKLIWFRLLTRSFDAFFLSMPSHFCLFEASLSTNLYCS